MIKVRGLQVAPAELEGHLLDHSAVDDVCVIGIADEYSGELPFAFVVPSPSAQQQIKNNKGKEEELRTTLMKVCLDSRYQTGFFAPCPFRLLVIMLNHEKRCTHIDGFQYVSDNKAAYKRLAGVEFTEQIAKNPSGKILRRLLRDHAKEMQKKGSLNVRYKSRL